MSGWGAKLLGVNSVLGTFDAISERFTAESTWVVGTPVEYAIYVELGTSRMSAQPYLRPAVERVGRNIQSYFKQASNIGEALALISFAIEAEAKKLCPVDTGNLRASIAAQEIRK